MYVRFIILRMRGVGQTVLLNTNTVSLTNANPMTLLDFVLENIPVGMHFFLLGLATTL